MARAERDMTRLDFDELRATVAEQTYPLVFATVSGAHLYGFPSRDSDVDLRGVHLLPAHEVIGLRAGPETLDRSWWRNGAEIDLVTHDAAKFFRLLLRRNGYVLEQLLSPLTVLSGDIHEELTALAPACLTRNHAHHYRGFARTQARLFAKSGELKPLLYRFRVLLTGTHLMRTGEVEASLPTLLGLGLQAPGYLSELAAAKTEGEHETLAAVDGAPTPEQVDADAERLGARLDAARDESTLPERPSAEPQLHDLLVRLRLGRADTGPGQPDTRTP